MACSAKLAAERIAWNSNAETVTGPVSATM
jgi:hypothetical protein